MSSLSAITVGNFDGVHQGHAALVQAAFHLGAGNSVVLDDYRFEIEAQAIRDIGGQVIRITGRGGIAGGHASEKMTFAADHNLCNAGAISDLESKLLAILTEQPNSRLN